MRTIPLAWMGQPMGFCGSWNGYQEFNWGSFTLKNNVLEAAFSQYLHCSEQLLSSVLTTHLTVWEHQAVLLIQVQAASVVLFAFAAYLRHLELFRYQ